MGLSWNPEAAAGFAVLGITPTATAGKSAAAAPIEQCLSNPRARAMFFI
ncbi:MAG: hypothetical protein AAFQ95_16745 [Cyanobacteria bacterium J06621_3]